MMKAFDDEYEGFSKSNSVDHPPVMRRFALFVDGMARAMILPFGPSLVYRLVFGSSEIDPTTWSDVAYYLAWVVAVYILGRWLGMVTAHQLKLDSERTPVYVARLGGAALSLHIFTYGAGLASVRWLVVIRFLSATLAGLLCGITSNISLPEDYWVYRDSVTFSEEERFEAIRRREAYVDIASGTAKIYLTGFSVSILSGGLLFRKATTDSTFRALTGAYQYSLSPMFLIAVAVSAEIILRVMFSFAGKSSDTSDFASPIRTNMKIDLGRRKLSITSFQSAKFHPSIDEHEEEEDEFGSIGNHSSRDDSRLLTPARNRMESHTSYDDFFDCHSIFSDVDIDTQRSSPSIDLEDTHAIDEHEIAQYTDGKVIYANGDAAYVPQGDCVATIPPNYLAFYSNNEGKARRAWELTQRWRLEKRVWKIHQLPNSWFDRIKEAYPHFVHGVSKGGYPVVYEQPGKMNLKELFRTGCAISDMVHHYTFFLEFISNRICPRTDIRSKLAADAPPHSSSSWGIMVVMDVKGAGLSHLSGDVVKYLKQAGDINSAHYPLSMKRAFLVNSPFWLAGAWSGLKGILPESVQVDILSESKYPLALREYIDEDQIPPEYGGTSPFSLGQHPFEVELRTLVGEAATHSVSEDSQRPPAIISTEQTNFQGSHRPTSPLPFSNPPISPAVSSKPVRRRVNSVDRQRRRLDSYNANDGYSSGKMASFGGETDIFVLVTFLYAVWSGIQAAIETALPLWILSPVYMGGLGYSPSRSGVSLFCASMVLLWTLRAKSSRFVSRIPSKAPMRAFRIGAGAESMLLALIASISSFTPPAERTDSVIVMASSIVLFACMALASMLGRSGSKILHRIASDSYARSAKPQGSWLANLYGERQLLVDCESGRLTAVINIAAEVCGVILVAPMWSWAVATKGTAPFDGTCVLFVCSLLTFVLYVCSFSLYLNSAGDFSPHPNDSCSDVKARRCLPFLAEAVAISAGDMASLFEEANWSSTPLLGRSRDRTLSVGSAPVEMMERGELPGRKVI